jgi:hypothetical protein
MACFTLPSNFEQIQLNRQTNLIGLLVVFEQFVEHLSYIENNVHLGRGLD